MYNFSTLVDYVGVKSNKRIVSKEELIKALAEFPDGCSAITLAGKLKMTTTNASTRLLLAIKQDSVERVERGVYKLVK